MINPNNHSSCSEFYEVTLSVVFVKSYGGEDRTFKVDALFDRKSSRYSTSAYIKEHVTLQPSYPVVNGSFTSKPTVYSIWVDFHNIGWTDRESAEAAIEQAIGFLS